MWVALAAALVSSPAVAHVGSSPQANNRYLTLVPEPGAVRLVYTLILGDSPGAAARRRMDRDDDGKLSADEQRAFASSIAGVIEAGLSIELDGEPVELAWSRVDVGIGSTAVRGGALSVDLAAIVCTDGGGEHALRLTDAFRVPPVGEGALGIEPSGVEVLRSAMGEGQGIRRAFKWAGRGQLADEGYTLAIRGPEDASAPPECDGPVFETEFETAAGAEGRAGEVEDRVGRERGIAGAVALVVVSALVVAIVARRRRSKQGPS